MDVVACRVCARFAREATSWGVLVGVCRGRLRKCVRGAFFGGGFWVGFVEGRWVPGGDCCGWEVVCGCEDNGC